MPRPRRRSNGEDGVRGAGPLDCGRGAKRDSLRTISAIVRAYLKLRPDDEQCGLGYYADAPNRETAIERAVLSRTKEGKRHSHQRRISAQVLRRAKTALLKADLDEIRVFDDLHERVHASIGRIKGIGELAVYDFSHRIGTYLGVFPDHVYLHCGTREGAKALGLDHKAAKLPLTSFPAPFRKLRPDQIEDCLCIFKDDFEQLG